MRFYAYVPEDPDEPIQPGLAEYLSLAIAGVYFLIFLFLCPKSNERNPKLH